jgi:hypothetical protein
MLNCFGLATNQAVGSSTSREAAQKAGFAGGPQGEGAVRVISPGAPYIKNSKLAKTLQVFSTCCFYPSFSQLTRKQRVNC